MAHNVSKIETIIRKLLAVSSDASTTPDEAASFAAKAQQLLIEHGLDEQSVLSKTQQSPVHQVLWQAPYADDSWRKMIAWAAGPAFMCKVVTTKVSEVVKSRKTGSYRLAQRSAFILIGTPERTAVLQSILDYLFSTIVRLAREHSRVRSEQLSFMRGAGVSVSGRLRDMAKPQDVEGHKTGSAMVLVSQALADVDAFTAENFSGLVKKTVRVKGGSGFSAGVDAGEKISLSPQVGDSPSAGVLE